MKRSTRSSILLVLLLALSTWTLPTQGAYVRKLEEIEDEDVRRMLEEDPIIEFDRENLEYCVALLGNGYKFWSYTAAFARLSEDVGSVECASGGSSASIMAFFVESIAINPSTRICGNRPCTNTEKRQREALLWKSFNAVPMFEGLFNAFVLNILYDIFILLFQFNSAWMLLQDDGYWEALQGARQRATRAFFKAFRNAGLSEMIPFFNFEALWMLIAVSPDSDTHIRDIAQSIKDAAASAGDFTKDRFFRTAFASWEHIARLWGKGASFYAGYGPYNHAAVDRWLTTCVPKQVGQTWRQAAKKIGSNGISTCGEEFLRIWSIHQKLFTWPIHKSRGDDPVGLHRPTVTAVSLITGDAVELWKDGVRQYRQAQFPVTFEPNFDDYRIGYFAKKTDLVRIKTALDTYYTDRFRPQRFHPLGGYTWQDVLSTSPAEPGLSPGVPLADDLVALGGWADPLRINVAYGLGAKRVVSILQRNDDHFFPVIVSFLLNADEGLLFYLYSLDFFGEIMQEIANATAVWCTDWGAFDPYDGDSLFRDAYLYSPVITTDPYFANVTNQVDSARIRACSPIPGL